MRTDPLEAPELLFHANVFAAIAIALPQRNKQKVKAILGYFRKLRTRSSRPDHGIRQ